MPLRLRDRWRLYRLRIAGAAVTERSCRRCGYPVRELTTPVCPECGADRDAAGTIEPLPRLRPNRWIVIGAWWVLAAAAVWLLWPIIGSLFPRVVSYNEDYMLMPHSGAYGPFQVRRIGYGTGWRKVGPWPTSVASAAVFQNTETAFNGRFLTDFTVYQRPQYAAYGTTRIDPKSVHQIAARASGGKPDADFFLRWLSEMEIDTSRADVQAEADELAGFMTAAPFDPGVYARLSHFTIRSMRSAKEAAPHPDHATVMMTATGLTLSLLSTGVVLRRTRTTA